MKLTKYAFMLLLGGSTLFSACSDDDNVAPQPKAAISVEKLNYEINESMLLLFTGDAENVVVYTGDTDHDYEKRTESNYGLVVNKGRFTYAYEKPGIYHVVCLATNHRDAGQSVAHDTTSVWVTVVDDVVKIDQISDPSVLYDEVFAKELDDKNWLLEVPRKVRYNGKDVPVNLKKQKLNFATESSSTVISLRPLADEDAEMVEYSTKSQYDLSKAQLIRSTAPSGNTRDYHLYAINYGEFKSFKVGSVTGKVDRTEYDYSYYWIDMEVAAGTDLTAIAPVWTLNDPDNETVYVGDQEVKSGDVFDFTNPVTFRFVVKSAENANITCESTCVVTITTK